MKPISDNLLHGIQLALSGHIPSLTVDRSGIYSQSGKKRNYIYYNKKFSADNKKSTFIESELNKVNDNLVKEKLYKKNKIGNWLLPEFFFFYDNLPKEHIKRNGSNYLLITYYDYFDNGEQKIIYLYYSLSGQHLFSEVKVPVYSEKNKLTYYQDILYWTIKVIPPYTFPFKI